MSEATVSRVLNGKPGVSEPTRQSVLFSLDVLGYSRPALLKRTRAGLVGLIIPELLNPIFPAFAQAIETSLARTGFTPVLCTQTPGGIHEDEYVQMLVERGVSGIIFISGLHADTAQSVERYVALSARGLPIVLVNGYCEGVQAPFISTDDRLAAMLAVSHLVALGHQRIGLAVGPDRFVPARRKAEGFRAALETHLGIADAASFIENSFFTVEGGVAAATALLVRGVTGIVAGSDMMALGAIRAARAMGRSVPDDVSVIGYDDSLLVAYTDPPLTTIRQSVRAMSDAAVQALLDRIAGSPVSHTEYVFSPELVVRESTTAAPRPAASAVPRAFG